MKHKLFNFLIYSTIICDLFYPCIVLYFGVTPNVRYLSHFFILVMTLIAFPDMIQQRIISKILILIGFISFVSITVALTNGQSIPATIWGWWMMFKLPLFGLAVFTEARFSALFLNRILKWGLILILIEVIIQYFQYRASTYYIDRIAGTLSSIDIGGTSSLVILIILFTSIFLANWVFKGKLILMCAFIVLGTISSLLGEMKVYFVCLVVLGAIGILVKIIKSRKIIPGVIAGFFFFGFFQIYPVLFDKYVKSAVIYDFFSYLNVNYFAKAFNSFYSTEGYGTTFGRNYLVSYVWNQIRGSNISAFFGMGLGARQQSATLHSMGIGLLMGNTGSNNETSLTIFFGETGVIGIVVLVALLLLLAYKLILGLKKNKNDANLLVINFGLLLFTLFMPLWFWYTTVWTLHPPMLIYWLTLAYYFQYQNNRRMNDKKTLVVNPIGTS